MASMKVSLPMHVTCNTDASQASAIDATTALKKKRRLKGTRATRGLWVPAGRPPMPTYTNKEWSSMSTLATLR